ncbi:MAG: class I SAM-dependent methyltransferase [Microcoleaceae cyanobacterium]
MAVRKDTIFEQFLAPVFKLLIDQEAMEQLYRRVDWDQEIERLTDPAVVYPNYYTSQNFHGIEGGYLTTGAAVSYDPITQCVLPPNETWIRQGVVDAIQGQPRRILDLGCGTGSTTLLLKQKFPDAEVIGLDLSPQMLIVADIKAREAGLEIQWCHGLAEQTRFPNVSFDLVTASLLFHETPPEISQAILNESFRLLRAGGEVVILDGNQKTLRQTEWLTNIFEEPYIQAYAENSVDAWLSRANFAHIRTQEWWWLNQVSHGIKPIPTTEPVNNRRVNFSSPDWSGLDGYPEPA